MEFSAIYHSMDKRFCFAVDEGKFLIRIKVKKNDLRRVILHYKDKYLPVKFIDTRRTVEMKKIASDRYNDYFEIIISIDVICLRYFFELEDQNGLIKYYGNYSFYDTIIDNNDRMFDCPQKLREEEMVRIPKWAMNKVVYQIFPSRFATDKAVNDEVWYKAPIGPFDNLEGNLRGICNRLMHMKELGVEILYMTPIFKSNSIHKYDTIDYYEIDPSFGTKEDLKELVDRAHDLGIRVILDGVFNHTSPEFFAFRDIMEKGEHSPYKDWYYIDSYPVVLEPGKKPPFLSFAYFYGMPKLNLQNAETAEYFINVGKYWLREVGIDGWRLDVGDEISHSFWKKFRNEIHREYADTLIIGEIWHYAGDFLEGDEWDTVMNYQFYLSIIDFVADERITASEFLGDMGFMRGNLHPDCYCSLLNLIDSHDTARFMHICGNKIKKMKLAAAIQLLSPGMPMIYYGDEFGMKGGPDPDCRRGMLWEKEKQNTNVFEWYKRLISIRKKYPAITLGEDIDTYTNDEAGLIVQTRRYQDEELTVIFHGKKGDVELSDLAGKKNLVNGKIFDGKVKGYEALVLIDKMADGTRQIR